MRYSIERSLISIILLFSLTLVTGCALDQRRAEFLPTAMLGKVEVLDSCDQNCDQEILSHAIMTAGQGGISAGVLYRLNQEVTAYRLWDGANKGLNEYGGSNRIGAWWTVDQPSGDVTAYRAQNAICKKWNDLRWVAKCKLKPGTVVAVGPTQSARCSDQEVYPSSSTLQIYVDNTSTRYVDCGKITDNDYPVNPDNLLLPASGRSSDSSNNKPH